MEYRKLPRGKENEKFGVLGLGMGEIREYFHKNQYRKLM